MDNGDMEDNNVVLEDECLAKMLSKRYSDLLSDPNMQTMSQTITENLKNYNKQVGVGWCGPSSPTRLKPIFVL